jgi:hypothetical protein
MTAASVGAHGSAVADPLGGGLAGGDSDGLGGGELVSPGVVSSGSAAFAVSDGCTVKVDASLEKSAHPAVTVSKSAQNSAGARRASGRRPGDRTLGRDFDIAVHGTAPAILGCPAAVADPAAVGQSPPEALFMPAPAPIRGQALTGTARHAAGLWLATLCGMAGTTR